MAMFRTSQSVLGFVMVCTTLFAAPPEPPRAKLVGSELTESYSGKSGVNVSGVTGLVGIVLGGAPNISDTADVLLASPQPGSQSRICVRVTTRDGLFWSNNPFDTPTAAAELIVAGPIAKRYLRELKTYPADEIMVRAVVPQDKDCSNLENAKVFVPAIGAPDGHLRAYLNTRGRAARAWLLKTGGTKKQLATVRCKEFPTGAVIAADRICKLVLPTQLPAGRYHLHVRITGSLEKNVQRYTVRLPRLM